jgi:hypothetical protein
MTISDELKKLTDEDIDLIRKLRDENVPTRDVSDKFEVSVECVRAIDRHLVRARTPMGRRCGKRTR